MTDRPVRAESPIGRYERTGVIPVGHGGEIAEYLREKRKQTE